MPYGEADLSGCFEVYVEKQKRKYLDTYVMRPSHVRVDISSRSCRGLRMTVSG